MVCDVSPVAMFFSKLQIASKFGFPPHFRISVDIKHFKKKTLNHIIDFNGNSITEAPM